MKTLRGLIARLDGSTLPGAVSFGQRIAAVETTTSAGAGDYILPGFIDLQVNGAGSIDVMGASAGALLDLSAQLARGGTTSWLPTAITSPMEQIVAVAAAVAEASTEAQTRIASTGLRAAARATILGMHLEGPFLSASRLGAHPPFNLVPRGEPLETIASLNALRMVTLAPELEGGLAAVAQLSERGLAVSIGHTDASLEQAQAAIAAGARMFTHTFNAMAPLHHRHPGAAGAAMLPSSALAAVIADGIHVHPEMLRLLLRTRGAGGVCLTSDSVAAGGDAAAPALAGAAIRDGAARMPDGRLVGSAISMLDAMKMMIGRVGTSVGEAALMAATNPARVLQLGDRGKIEIGARADFLLLGPALELKAVFINGCELD